jgi:hypothetical protein
MSFVLNEFDFFQSKIHIQKTEKTIRKNKKTMDQLVKIQDIRVTYNSGVDYGVFRARFEQLSAMYEKMSSAGVFSPEELDLFKKQVLIANISMALASFGYNNTGQADIIGKFEKLAALRKQLPAPEDCLDARMKCITRLKDIRRGSYTVFREQSIDCNTRVSDLEVIIKYVTN